MTDEASLTGVWDGFYSYLRRLSPTPFTAVVIRTRRTPEAARVSERLTEPVGL